MQFRQRNCVEIKSTTVCAYQGFNQMISHVNKNPGVNYYDVLAHAYDNDNDLWLYALSKDSKSVKKYIRSKAQKEHINFLKPMYKSYFDARKSAKNYYERHKTEFI